MMAELCYVGTRKGLFVFSKTKSEWRFKEHHFLGDPVSAVETDGKNIYVALKHGHFGCKFHVSQNAGGSWQEFNAPAYPEPKEGEVCQCPVRGINIPWKLDMLWTLKKSSGGRLWAGTIPGGLFYSDDEGQNWKICESLWYRDERKAWCGGGYDYPGIHSICIDPGDSNRIFIAISCGGVWESKDNGDNWELIGKGLRAAYLPPDKAFDPNFQDPHCMVQCKSKPERFWIQHHNGIFISNDYAKTWKEIVDIQPSTFGFAVAVDPNNGNKAWFAPATKDELRIPKDGNFIVNLTEDGGETFEAQTKGLPQSPAWDLVYRHSLIIDENGESLAMGSTTGNLWFSDSQSNEWQQASSNLPPINCIKFS